MPWAPWVWLGVSLVGMGLSIDLWRQTSKELRYARYGIRERRIPPEYHAALYLRRVAVILLVMHTLFVVVGLLSIFASLIGEKGGVVTVGILLTIPVFMTTLSWLTLKLGKD